VFLPKDSIDKETSKLSPAARVHQAEYVASGLIGDEDGEARKSPWTL
jgi:hypothetical protein